MTTTALALKPFHSFEIEGHEPITGPKPLAHLRAEAEIYFGFGIEGKTLIDIGAWDGWMSFEAERRGAKATACDWFCWSGPGWGTDEVFRYVRDLTGSKVDAIECDIPDLDPAKHGTYDIVLLAGVLYHVRDMLSILEKAQALARECVIIETQTIPGDQPMARYWTLDTLNGDGSNFWTPTVRCVEDMMREFGFTRFAHAHAPFHPQTGEVTRHIIHCWRI